jgi:hypothetical protein
MLVPAVTVSVYQDGTVGVVVVVILARGCPSKIVVIFYPAGTQEVILLEAAKTSDELSLLVP